MLTNVEAVIFDMDGTLVDSMWVWDSIDVDFYERHGLVEPEDFKIKMEGMSFPEVAALFLETFPTLPFTSEELQNHWTKQAMYKYTNEVPLKPGVREFLISLKEKGIKLGIATSNGAKLVSAVLKALDVEQYFDSVHTAGEVEKGKPAPDIYLLVAKDLGVSPSKCLVFEDVPMGIQAGRNAGMKVCGVYDKYSESQEEKKRALSDYYIESYHELNDK